MRNGLAWMIALAVTSCGQANPVTPLEASKSTAAATTASGKAPTAHNATATMANVPTNAWIGRWVGPEGLFLDIASKGGEFSGRYTLKMQYTLDKRASVEGMAHLDTIVFERDGEQHVLRAGTGAQSGMKWLADKRQCLIVGTAEAYCRP